MTGIQTCLLQHDAFTMSQACADQGDVFMMSQT